jgi:hypothetical protein
MFARELPEFQSCRLWPVPVWSAMAFEAHLVLERVPQRNTQFLLVPSRDNPGSQCINLGLPITGGLLRAVLMNGQPRNCSAAMYLKAPAKWK